jgi:hypothetical protein
MKKIISTLMCLFLFLLPLNSYSEGKMTRLQRGQCAAYPGVLIDDEGMASIKVKYEDAQKICTTNLEAAKQQKDVECSAELNKKDIKCSADKDVEQQKTKRKAKKLKNFSKN